MLYDRIHKICNYAEWMNREESENELLMFVKNQSMIDIKYTNNPS